MKPLIIFDLDGTLADSKKDLCASVNYVREHFGMDRIGEAAIAAMIGDGAEALIERALGDGASTVGVRQGLELFLGYYRDHMLDETRLYAGVRETLGALADCELAVLTNKPYRFSCRMLDGLGIYDFFSAVYGGNSLPVKKPDPLGVHRILADTGARPEVTWMVGDSSVDVLTGSRAGVRTCGVTYGYDAQSFRDNPPDFLIDQFQALEGVVRGSAP
jgi:phosphoglycolate phosphatase